MYGASTMSNNVAKLRANFRIGIREDGRLYGLFDTSDAVTSGEGPGTSYVLGAGLVSNEWRHVALSYNGSTLALFMDGVAVGSVQTTQIPANGLVNFIEDAIPNMANFPVLLNGYTAVPSAMVLGAHALDYNAVALSDKSTWTSYEKFYAGYIDEVRVWDGARKQTDMVSDMRKRYSFDDVSSIRDTVFMSWIRGATRNDNDGKDNLPAELIAHYNFQTLPGATESKYVEWEPSGFTKNVRNLGKVEGNNVPGDIYCGWWYAMPVHSTIYNNYRLVPWIQNTVSHLPLMDGSAVDSQFWSENFGGTTPAGELGVEKIEFPNTANPYPYYIYTTDRRFHQFALDRLNKFGLDANLAKRKYEYELRTTIIGSSDLVPLGGAFALRGTNMWDNNGPMTAWEMTGRDLNANGIPDWWEKVAIADYGATAGFGWNDIVTWNGREMTAREAYIRDLQRGMVPTGTSTGSVDDSLVDIADIDNDGLPDWWEDLYGIRSQNCLDDADSDGLSNYAEFLISECFSKYGFPRVSPILAQTFAHERGQKIPDYFIRVGRSYLGDMFADHDFMEDSWEDQFDPDFVSRFMFDAWNDTDDDGWSNYAECRSAYWRGYTYTDILDTWVASGDDYNFKCYPMPTLAVMTKYNGLQPVSGKRIVVRAKRNSSRGWDVRFVAEGDDDQGSETGRDETKILGITHNGPRHLHGHLHPGHILPDSGVKFEWRKFKSEVSYKWHCTFCGQPTTVTSYDVYNTHRLDHGEATESGVEGVVFEDTVSGSPEIFAQSESGPDGRTGMIVTKNSGIEVGTIDFFTGEYELDLGKAAEDGYDLSDSFLRASWNYRIGLDWPQTLYFSLPRESEGRLKEGLNTIEAFIDIDANGEWTPGEPYGAVSDVDIGWAGNSVAIELTDTSPSIMRINLRDAVAAGGFDEQNLLTDRGVLGNGAAPNVAMLAGTNMPKQTETSVRVRIALTAVNGHPTSTSGTVYPNDVVFDQRIDLTANPVLTEKDLLSQGMLDLEWGTLTQQGARLGEGVVTSATYRVVIGDGSIASSETNNNLAVGFVNRFDIAQQACTFVSPQGAIYSQPTFTWKCNSAIGKSYPAFRLRVASTTGGRIIYDSGDRPVPPRNLDGSYSWTAPIYPDMMTPNGEIFSTTNNYFWTVSMLDAKFTTPSGAAGRQEFRLEASGQLGKISDYGMIRVKVRYFGPGTVATDNLNGLIRVQAFTSPDFTGMPAGEAMVTDVSKLSAPGDIDVNAVILGIKPGTYYIRAFIDSDGDAKWSPWESWGYCNYVGASDAVIASTSRGLAAYFSDTVFPFLPRPYTVAVDEVPPTVEIYMEDMDSDADHLPDVYEYNTEGSLAARSAPNGSTFFTKVNRTLGPTVESYTKLNASSSGQTYAPITLMNSIISGSDPVAMAAAIDFFAGSSAGTENVAVRIDSFSLADGLSLSITSDVQAADAGDLSVFVTTDSADVKVVLMASDSPDFSKAKETVVKSITIRANVEAKEVVSADELRTAIDAAGLGDAAFFKVKLVQ